MSSQLSVFVFGNPDLPMDALPLRVLPALRGKFPDVEFRVLDPNEDWNIPLNIIVLDTVVGISEPRIFHGLEDFHQTGKMSVHDFDAYMNLTLLRKIGKLKSVTIIGVPPEEGEEKALLAVTTLLKSFIS
jgi:hypothetical protein